MSYILDALRKSELERRPGAAARAQVLRDPGPALLPPRRLAWYAVPIAGVLVLAVGAYLLLMRPADQAPVTIAVDDATASAPVPSAPTTPPAPAAQNAPVPVASPAASEAPAPKASPVRDLAEQTRIASKPAPRTVARAAAPRTSAPVARTVADDVRLLRLMPPDFQGALPQMVVNIHVYSIAEAERILYINNRQYHAGDKVRDDVVVEEIVEDGAVLSFRGQRFKLPRPS